MVAPMPLQAATIVNVDSSTKEFEVKTSKGYEPVALQGGEVWRKPGKLWVRYKAQEIFLNEDDEYAFWSHDGFGPQRRFSHGASKLQN